jgi:hypothetical protein
VDNRLDNHNPSGRCLTTNSHNAPEQHRWGVRRRPGRSSPGAASVAAPPLRAKRSAAEHVLPPQAMDGVVDGFRRPRAASCTSSSRPRGHYWHAACTCREPLTFQSAIQTNLPRLAPFCDRREDAFRLARKPLARPRRYSECAAVQGGRASRREDELARGPPGPGPSAQVGCSPVTVPPPIRIASRVGHPFAS